MKIKRILRTLLILVVLSSNIGCDQISKHMVRQSIAYHEQITLVNPFLTLTNVENTGAILSVGQSLPEPIKSALLIILPLLVLVTTFVYLLEKKNLELVSMIGLCFIVGGGVGNIYDRILYGSVTDFIYMDFRIFHTGIFNLADVSVMAGTLLVVVSLFFRPTNVNDKDNALKNVL